MSRSNSMRLERLVLLIVLFAATSVFADGACESGLARHARRMAALESRFEELPKVWAAYATYLNDPAFSEAYRASLRDLLPDDVTVLRWTEGIRVALGLRSNWQAAMGVDEETLRDMGYRVVRSGGLRGVTDDLVLRLRALRAKAQTWRVSKADRLSARRAHRELAAKRFVVVVRELFDESDLKSSDLREIANRSVLDNLVHEAAHVRFYEFIGRNKARLLERLPRSLAWPCGPLVCFDADFFTYANERYALETESKFNRRRGGHGRVGFGSVHDIVIRQYQLRNPILEQAQWHSLHEVLLGIPFDNHD